MVKNALYSSVQMMNKLVIFLVGLAATSAYQIRNIDIPHATTVRVLSINSENVSLGFSISNSKEYQAFLINGDHVIVPLIMSQVSCRIIDVFDINDNGWVVGMAAGECGASSASRVAVPDTSTTITTWLWNLLWNTNRKENKHSSRVQLASYYNFQTEERFRNFDTIINEEVYAFVRYANGVYRFLPPREDVILRPIKINKNGVVCGDYITAEHKLYTFIWYPNGTLIVFGVSDRTVVKDINDVGAVVGYDGSEGIHGFGRRGNDIISLNYPEANMTSAVAINNQGTIAGVYVSQQGECGAFIRYINGTWISPKPQRGSIHVTDITEDGRILGTCYNEARVSQGCIWSPNKEIIYFSALGLDTYPQRMNDHGRVVEKYRDGNRERVFVYIP